MTKKKPILLLASAAALTLALHESALSAPPLDESAPPAATTESAAAKSPDPGSATQGPAAAPEPAPANPWIAVPAPPEQTAATPPPQPASTEAAPAEMPAATSIGPASKKPEPPASPQIAMPGAGEAQPGKLTWEERSAQRQQKFQEMRDRAMKRRQEMTTRWDSYWKILDALSPEQKEAVQAVLGAGKKRCSHRGMSHRMPHAIPTQPRFGQPEHGFPSGSAFPDYGYGPQGGEPYPYERGPATVPFGEQAMHPGGALPWYGLGQESFQGPPPPSADHPHPSW